MHDGIANWSIKPPDDMNENDTITLQLSVRDDVIDQNFINVVKLTAKKPIESSAGKSARRSSTSGGGGQQPQRLALPTIKDVTREEWKEYEFNEYSALKIVQETDGSYTFFINISNKYMLIEAKDSKDFELIKAQFRYGLVLVGIALIQEHSKLKSEKGNEGDEDEQQDSIEKKVVDISRAIATVIIPIIRSLSKITENDISNDGGQIGDEE